MEDIISNNVSRISFSDFAKFVSVDQSLNMKHTEVHCSNGPLIHNGPLFFTIFPNDLFSLASKFRITKIYKRGMRLQFLPVTKDCTSSLK